MIRNRCPLRFRNGVVDDSRQREDRTLAQVAQAGVHPAPGSFGESGRFRILRGGVAEIARVLKAKGAPGARLWG
jgi:hypothetical protein